MQRQPLWLPFFIPAHVRITNYRTAPSIQSKRSWKDKARKQASSRGQRRQESTFLESIPNHLHKLPRSPEREYADQAEPGDKSDLPHTGTQKTARDPSRPPFLYPRSSWPMLVEPMPFRVTPMPVAAAILHLGRMPKHPVKVLAFRPGKKR